MAAEQKDKPRQYVIGRPGIRGLVQWNRTLLFETYRFDNLATDESQFLDGWSYFWAALGGPVYVLFRGFPLPAAAMLLISIALATTAAATVVAVVGLVDHTLVSLIAVIGIPLAALAAQSLIAIQLMRAAFIRRGWREGY